jgi:pimeloyl-ACP methyl ester carboxylesterase/DNA-binding CsgD family transcriptional regulator
MGYTPKKDGGRSVEGRERDIPGSALEGSNPRTITDVDLDLVANSYRSLVDSDAYDTMMAAWGRRLGFEQSTDEKLELAPSTDHQMRAMEALINDLPVETPRDPMTLAVQEFASAAMVLSAEGRVMALNTSAAERFHARQGSICKPDWLDPGSEADYRAILQSARVRKEAQHTILKTADEGAAEKPDLAEAYSFEIEGHSQTYVVIRLLDFPWASATSTLLMSSFALTESEAEICRLLYLCRDIEVVAEKRSVSVLTVRTQVKAILSKTGLENRVELIRLLGVLCARQSVSATTRRWSDPIGRERLLTRPCGRKLGYTWFGDERGTPVIMVHGPGIGPYFSDEIDAPLRRAGVRLLAISRPGYGHSDPKADRSPVDEQVEAIGWFCEAMGLKSVPAVGLGCGIVSLAKLAAQKQTPISALMLLGYFMPMNKDRLGRQSKVVQTYFSLTRKAPWLLDMLVKIGHRILVQKDSAWYLERACAESPVDLATARDPRFAAFLRLCGVHMFGQGPGAFKRDFSLVWEPLETWLAASKGPFTWIVGGAHPAFHEADAREVARNAKAAELRIVPDAGELLIYQRPDLVAQAIIAAAKGIALGDAPAAPEQVEARGT